MHIADRGYAQPDALVSTEWVAAHLDDPSIRLVESNEDVLLYDVGHIPGAVKVDWQADLNDTTVRDYINQTQFAALMGRLGIANDTTVIFYGDKNNWWATYAYWVFQLFGHRNAKVMDGGRMKWVAEGRDLTRELPTYPAARYTAQERNDSAIRAFRNEVLAHIAVRWWMCAAPANTRESCCTWPTTRRKARCGAGIFQGPRACRGRVQPTRMAPSRAQPSCGPSTNKNRGSAPTTM